MRSYVPACFASVVSAVFGLNFVSNYTQVPPFKYPTDFSRPVSHCRNQVKAPPHVDFLQNPALQIQLPDGLIQGRLKHTVGIGMPYYSFEGIPYAKPPVGRLRFRPPEAPLKWDGVLDADGDVPGCVQITPASGGWYESEDCLYINVYVAKPPSGPPQLKPVMVWIYGGGFLFGVANSTYYGPDFLLEDDVIVVHFNYRINVFGFLSTEDSASPGNYGLKDQLAALRWVRDNIRLFGGDPDKITIFGESAGGASVQYHLLSPKSRGLFRGAISESGSALCPWALQPEPVKIAGQIALSTGFPGGSSEDMVEHLRGLSTRKLKRAALGVSIVNSVNVATSLPFSPTLEPEHEDAFISERSYELLKAGDFERVPYIVGFNSQEAGGVRMGLEFGEPLLGMLPSQVLIPPGLNNRAWGVGDEIKEFYFENDQPKTQQYLDFISDSYFYRPITESARLYSIYAPIYMYRFSYEGYFLGKRAFSMGEESTVNGVMHSEEVWYIFSRADLRHANATDERTRRRMVRLWTNFAKFGDPTPVREELLQNVSWSRFERDDYPYLDIDREMTMRRNFKRETLEFWRGLFAKHGRPPFDTY
ncbi:cholinesterase 1-like [Asbolus verrucosus]|uniref:Carboxylic ester hydrolase n=1 Tax=Asbolus verrucosus TaxID=1661398 RepID=A0A482VNJ4_ASBVE|nr:cholinesterase 1-like [Asbolus verrucosus]